MTHFSFRSLTSGTLVSCALGSLLLTLPLPASANTEKLLLEAAVTAKNSPPKPMPSPVSKPGSLAPVMTAFIESHVISGGVLMVANREKVLDWEAFGYARLGANPKPMEPDAVFAVASMTKTVTAVALLMLIDEGKVELDAPIEKYLPEFKGQMVQEEGEAEPRAPKRPVIVRDIMTHSAGFVSAKEDAVRVALARGMLKDRVALAASKPMRWEPGTQFEYGGLTLACEARIVEVISGLAFADFVQQRIFDPLGMKSTSFFPNAEMGKRLAYTMKYAPEGLREMVEDKKDLSPEILAKQTRGVPVPREVIENSTGTTIEHYAVKDPEPAGGLFSSAEDMMKFCQMLLNGGELNGKRYLSAKMVETMAVNQTAEAKRGPGGGHGLGCFVEKADANNGLKAGSFGHTGARSTMMWVDPKNNLAMVLMVQIAGLEGKGRAALHDTFMKAAIEKFGAAGK